MTTLQMTRILGGEKVLNMKIESPMDLFCLAEQGISKTALRHLARYMNKSLSQMASFLPVTNRTIQRYSPRQKFNRVVSEHILLLAELAARGVDVFGDKDKFFGWMNTPNKALGGEEPSDLMKSTFGVYMILDVLGRIEHGIVS